MLKQNVIVDIQPVLNPAAFGRLCVETGGGGSHGGGNSPAAFGRLCVETYEGLSFAVEGIPAAFGRLCVETF